MKIIPYRHIFSSLRLTTFCKGKKRSIHPQEEKTIKLILLQVKMALLSFRRNDTYQQRSLSLVIFLLLQVLFLLLLLLSKHCTINVRAFAPLLSTNHQSIYIASRRSHNNKNSNNYDNYNSRQQNKNNLMLYSSLLEPPPSTTTKNKNDKTIVRRVSESAERVREVRERFRKASEDAANARGCAVDEKEAGNEWWRKPIHTNNNNNGPPSMARTITKDDPLRVVIAGGGVAGLVAAAACHAKGMKVAIFEQASQYAPYGGPIQIQSNALRALEQINTKVYEEITKAGTITADRVSGLKIGYKKGVFLGLGQQYNKGDWLVRFDTLQPALQAGLPPTRVVDRPVIQQILLEYGLPPGTVRIKSRIASYEELGTNDGSGLKIILEDGTVAYADVLIGADGIWSSVRRVMHQLDTGADGFAASGAAGGALNEIEARRLAKDSVLMAANANRRYSGFTCYAALTEHRASNIEEVSYQILLGKDKYFVSTDGGGERQQWFALIREDAGGVDPEPTVEQPTPKLDRLLYEFNHMEPGDCNGDVWDDFAYELISSTSEQNIKRRDLYDGSPLLMKGWTRGQVAICGDAAHPMMPNLGQGGCQATEDGYRIAEELATVKHTKDIEHALQTYYTKRITRTTIIQILAQLGSDLLVDFDKMMTIPFVGPFFLYMTQVSMPFILRFLYTAEF